jgi:hypothetical protein
MYWTTVASTVSVARAPGSRFRRPRAPAPRASSGQRSSKLAALGLAAGMPQTVMATTLIAVGVVAVSVILADRFPHGALADVRETVCAGLRASRRVGAVADSCERFRPVRSCPSADVYPEVWG